MRYKISFNLWADLGVVMTAGPRNIYNMDDVRRSRRWFIHL